MRKIEYADSTSKEERQKISRYYAKLDRSICRKNRKKKKVLVKKPLINYKKGISYDEFLRSEYWDGIRKKVKIRDDFKCTVCGSKTNLQVHHTTYKHLGTEYKHLDDLLTACIKCHQLAHGIL